MSKKKILVSTDIGSDIDDALSLLSMINSGMNLDGIYVVNGNVNAKACIAKHMVRLAENRIIGFLHKHAPFLMKKIGLKPIDVITGDAQPIGGVVAPYTFCEDCYVEEEYVDEEKSEGSKDIVFKRPEKIGIRTNGLKDLVSRLSEGKHIVLSLAPMTLIGRLVLEHPEQTKNIEHLYLMGCRFEDLANEHNIRYDLPAAHIVLSSNIPVTIVPSDMCDRYKLPVQFLENLKSRAGKYVKKMALGHIGALTANMLQREHILDLIRKDIFNEYSRDPKVKLEKFYQKMKGRDFLLANLNDPLDGAFEQEKYFEQLRALIEHLKDPEINYRRGDIVSRALEQCVPKTIPISDVYVPYCFLFPERTLVHRGTVVVGGEGQSQITEGTKHRIITDIDYSHFQEFLRQSLY